MGDIKKMAGAINSFCDKSSWNTCIEKTNLEALENFGKSIPGLDAQELNEQIEALCKIKYSDWFSVSSDFNEAINNIISVAYDISQSYSSNTDASDQEKLETQFLNQEEVVEAFIEHAENPVKFQQRVAKWAEEKWNEYKLFAYIITFILSNFVQPYFQQEVGMPVMSYVVSNVKEIPEKTGKVICH